MDQQTIRIEVYDDVAAELLTAGEARKVMPTRNSVHQFITTAVDGINTSASMVTLLVATNAVRKVVAGLWHRARQSGQTTITLTTERSGERIRTLTVDVVDPDGPEKMLEFIIESTPTPTPTPE